MKRREFIVALAGAIAWPLAARAQQPKLPVIGYLGTTTPVAQSHWTAAFVQRLRELGWSEGRTIAIEYRWANGRDERYVEIAAEFARLKVDVIIAGGLAVPFVKKATSIIPIVFAAAGNPVLSGLVASLARPGGNVTGLSLQSADLAGKRVGLMRDVIPRLGRLAFLVNADNPNSVLEQAEVQAAARTFGLDVAITEIRQVDDIAPAIDALKGHADALYVQTDPLVTTNPVRINTLALGARLPTNYGAREYVEAGGLISYGPNFPDMFRRAAEFVDKILRGAKPADIPVEESIKYELVINLNAARALGLTIPTSLLARADEVIE